MRVGRVDPLRRPTSSIPDSVTGPVLLQPILLTVPIDIKPGSDTNPINLKSKGKIPVAILSTTAFDATQELDENTITFGKAGAENSRAKCSKDTEDVNGDALLDLVCHFNTADTGFEEGDTDEGTPHERFLLF